MADSACVCLRLFFRHLDRYSLLALAGIPHFSPPGIHGSPSPLRGRRPLPGERILAPYGFGKVAVASDSLLRNSGSRGFLPLYRNIFLGSDNRGSTSGANRSDETGFFPRARTVDVRSFFLWLKLV